MNKRIIKILSHKNDYYIALDKDGNKYFIKNNNNDLKFNGYYLIMFKNYRYFVQNKNICNMTIDYYKIKPAIIKNGRFVYKNSPIIYKNILLEKLISIQNDMEKIGQAIRKNARKKVV